MDALVQTQVDAIPPRSKEEVLNEDLQQAIQKHAVDLNLISGKYTLEPIIHGGSDREFYRVHPVDAPSWILLKYSEAREENGLYADIAIFLKGISLQVPRVLFHDVQARLMGLEDLGETSLYSFFHQHSDFSEVRPLYESALKQAALLHRQTLSPVRLMPGFDEKLYRWEVGYFLEHLVGNHMKIQIAQPVREKIMVECEGNIAELMKIPRCLIHRDFQSQNLVVRQNTVWFIDFQGMRLGHGAYDVASLLYDPYVNLEDEDRRNLLKVYVREKGEVGDEFDEQFYRAAAQRLMQALGAYGFLGLVKGKRDYLKYIPSGVHNLIHALEHLGSMKQMLELARKVQSML